MKPQCWKIQSPWHFRCVRWIYYDLETADIIIVFHRFTYSQQRIKHGRCWKRINGSDFLKKLWYCVGGSIQDNCMVLSAELMMWISHCTVILKLTFRALALQLIRARSSDQGLTLETSAFPHKNAASCFLFQKIQFNLSNIHKQRKISRKLKPPSW